MRHRKLAAAVGAAAFLLLPAKAKADAQRVCAAPAPLHAACMAEIVTEPGSATPFAAAEPHGYGPADLQSAYGLSPVGGAGRTVAIVDAYDYPTAAQDLGVYRSHYGLPPCIAAVGCFRKVNQTGGSKLPPANASWAQETALDLDMVSATCPDCRILLVEANSSSIEDLANAEDTAAKLGANVISNSYGGAEFSGETSAKYNSHYDHPGVAITASSGDDGFGVSFPAASQYVTAVGGTTLQRGGGARGWTETAWAQAGSGCSAFVVKPPWQLDRGCSGRTIADVAAVADPTTGVATYDSAPAGGKSGWFEAGGTSVSAPIVAGIFGQGGGGAPSMPYAGAAWLFDVTSGANGSCSVQYLCTAGPGYDGPTGLGTPNGIGAF
jgi:subtilase family serine protease